MIEQKIHDRGTRVFFALYYAMQYYNTIHSLVVRGMQE